MPEAALTTFAIATEGLAGEAVHGPPSVAITSPFQNDLVNAALDVTWTYTPNLTNLLAQGFYRLRLYSSDRALTYYDTGWVTGADVTATIPVTYFSDTLSYQVGLMARPVAPGDTGADDSAEVYVLVTADFGDVTSFPDVTSVGTIYEIAINGVGYMLADMTDNDRKYSRKSVALDSQRFATGSSPFSEAVDRYVFRNFSDFTGGAGQRYLDHENSSPTAYMDSENVNPFEPGKLTMNPALHKGASITGGDDATDCQPPTVTVFNGLWYVAPWKFRNGMSAGSAAGTFLWNIAAATDLYDVTSSGESWYVAGGTDGIFRNQVAADPGAAWSAVPAIVVEWIQDRVAVAYPSAGTAPNVFSTLADDGTEEVAFGRLTLPEGTSITQITSGGGKCWFVANSLSSDRGAVYVWTIGSADPPTVALEFPVGQRPTAVYAYQGNVFLRVAEWVKLSLGYSKAYIFRCVPDAQGALTPTLVTTLGDSSSTVDQARGTFTARGTKVFFTWMKMTLLGSTNGIGAIDLIGGGWCKWTYQWDVNTTISGDLFTFAQSVIWAYGGPGDSFQFAQDSLPTNGGIIADGWLKTSLIDGNSNLLKIYDTVSEIAQLESAAQTVTIDYSTDGAAYTPLPAVTLTGPNQSIEAVWAKRARMVSFKIGLNGFTSKTSMYLASFTVKLHQLGLADQIILCPVLCDDNLTNLSGKRLDLDSGPGKGSLRARVLEAFAQQRVKFQDKDWGDTRTSQIVEVINVDTAEWSVRAPNRGQVQESLVATLTLRRALQ